MQRLKEIIQLIVYYKDEFKFQFLNNNIVFNVEKSGLNIIDTLFQIS